MQQRVRGANAPLRPETEREAIRGDRHFAEHERERRALRR